MPAESRFCAFLEVPSVARKNPAATHFMLTFAIPGPLRSLIADTAPKFSIRAFQNVTGI